MSLQEVKVIAFDADDTLWHNEVYFRAAEDRFFEWLKPYSTIEDTQSLLLETEIENLTVYGYGIKGFMLSMLETARKIAGDDLPLPLVYNIMDMGRDQLKEPVVLMEGIVEVLKYLSQKYLLVVITKGDLLDQERKLEKSGLAHFFHHIEIVSEKKAENYQKVLRHLNISPDEFVMIGNSLKSDILPVLEIGSYAIHIPYATTWVLEHIDTVITHDRFYDIQKVSELKELF
jgi:putative hydrolase of the HAD superfamily